MVPYEDDSEYHDFLKVNMHLKARNKLRLDQLVFKEGGVDNYISYMEKKVPEKRSNTNKSS